MRRLITSLLAAMAMLAILSTAVFAANAHVVGSPTATQSGNSITFSAKVAGLGNTTATADFSLVGSIDVNSRCYTRSGNKPQAANKQESISVNDTKSFPVRNGSATPTFTISPLSTLQCPGGQHVVIESFTYNLALVYNGETLYTWTLP